MPEEKNNNRFSRFTLWVFSCFFFSGMAGLIYQVLWLRMIGKVIGSAPFAVATVLSVFMGGLALGSRLAGKHIDRIGSRRNLLSLYGKLEIAIGIYGLLLPLFIYGAKPLHILTYNSLFLHSWLYRFFTFLGCSLLLILPTTLMGATLPILCRFYVENLGHIGNRTGRLHGVNTLGAAAGALLCGFVLIAALGVRGTLWTAVTINVLVGILCIALARGSRPLASASGAAVSGKRENGSAGTLAITGPEDRGTLTLSLWIFAVSGFCAMAYEVFWTRLLELIIGPTTYAFSLVASTFILGLALGNILFGRLADRVRNTFFLLVVTQACAALFALLASQFLGNSQFFFSKLSHTFQGNFEGKVLVQSGILFFTLLGPTLFLGAAFPLVNRIYARSLPNIGRSIGAAYAANTIGAVLGAFVAGFFFIPLLGKESGLKFTAGLQIVLSLLAMAYMISKNEKKIRPAAACLATLLIASFSLTLFPSWNRNALSRGWHYRYDALKQHFASTTWFEAAFDGTPGISTHVKDTDVVFFGEGIGGFTAVEKWVDPTGVANYHLLNSGKTDATSHSDRLTQALAAHVPLLFHPNPEKVMVLGLASGMTAGEALHYPIERLDVLEINEQIIKAADFFTPYNNGCLTNPKTRVIVQDGRNHLELTRETYDVVISGTSTPWLDGLADLFTLDFFQTARDRLAEDGIFVQRTNAYGMDWDSFSMIGRTFAEVFPNGLLVKTNGASDFLLVGFAGERDLDLDVARKNLAHAMKSQNVAIRDTRVILNLITTGNLKEFFGPGPMHTADRPCLEFTAPGHIGKNSRAIEERIREGGRPPEEIKYAFEAVSSIDASLDYLELMTAGPSPPFRDVDLANAASDQVERYQDLVETYCSESYVTDYDIFPDSGYRKQCAALQLERIEKHLSANPDDSTAYYRLAMGIGAMGNAERKISALETAISLTPSFYDAYMALGETFAAIGRHGEAVASLKEALKINPNAAETYNNLGNALADQGKTDEAISHYKKAFKIDPDFAKAYNNLGCVYAGLADTDEALHYFTKAIDIDPDYAAAHNNLGRVYADQGRLEAALPHFLSAVRIAPESAVFHNDAGLVLGRLGRIDESIERFTEALRLDPTQMIARYNLGLGMLNQERFTEAAEHLFAAAEVYPDDPEIHRMLGFALGNLERIEAAAGHLSKAVRLDPGSAITHDNLGVALLQLGRIDEAIEQFHEALDIEPSLNSALDHLKVAVKAREKNGD
jgi:spermidine synthase